MKNSPRCTIYCDGKTCDLYRVKSTAHAVSDDNNEMRFVCEQISSHQNMNQATAAMEAWLAAQKK